VSCLSNQRARRLSVPGTINRKEWFLLRFAYGFRCASCGRVAALTLDHIIPMWRGGCNWLFNAQPLCLVCHRSKTLQEEYARHDTQTTEEVLNELMHELRRQHF
jgi:5-methylcytosine-specific restriction endonuclease McrA